MTAPQVSSIKQYFDTLNDRFIASASKGVKATFQFELAGDGGGTYHVTIDDGTMAVAEGPADAPSTTIKMAADDYIQMVNGKLSGTMAFMKGKLKVSGNVMLAQKMQAFLPPSK
ncbi:MAG: SCP2 sterol-binding domain-containing protein [Polyangiaceae bacterium]|jgi:putative sterol carrier protein